MLLRETILCATAVPSTESGSGGIFVHDIQTGTALASFKQTNSDTLCTDYVESGSSEGGFILAAQPDKAILNVYNFQKDQMSLKIVLPEKISCIATDRKGIYCAGGTTQGRIYLWEISSGIMYNSWDAHYRKVTVLKFTSDGSALLSGSEDSCVSVWSVSRLVDDEVQNELPLPFCMLSDHTLPVTDIICGIGIFPQCRVLTSSIDHSVKLWDISTKSLLTTFQFPQPITSLAWDLTERFFFAASGDGSIHQMNLFRHKEDKTLEAIGGAGVADVIRIGSEDPTLKKKRLISVGQPVTCLTISMTSALLLVGTSTGSVNLYDIPSHQLLRTISTHKGLRITYLATMLKPPDLVGHVSLQMGVGNVADDLPIKVVAPFQRTRDKQARDAHEVTMMLPVQDDKYYLGIEDEYTDEEFLRDYAYFVQPNKPSNESGTAVSSQKVTELEAEVAHLKAQLVKAKSVNDMMWENVVRKVILPKTNENGGLGAGDGRMEVDGST